MPETIIVVSGSVPGHTANTEKGGSYVSICKDRKEVQRDGRFWRDPIHMWRLHCEKGINDGVDDENNITKTWTWKTTFGRDTRWVKNEVKKYWPDGYPGYDHSADPFHDDCDPRLAMKQPEW